MSGKAVYRICTCDESLSLGIRQHPSKGGLANKAEAAASGDSFRPDRPQVLDHTCVRDMLFKVLQQPPGARGLKQQVNLERDRCGEWWCNLDRRAAGRCSKWVLGTDSSRSSIWYYARRVRTERRPTSCCPFAVKRCAPEQEGCSWKHHRLDLEDYIQGLAKQTASGCEECL